MQSAPASGPAVCHVAMPSTTSRMRKEATAAAASDADAEPGLPAFPHGDGQAHTHNELRDPERGERVEQGSPVEAGQERQQDGYERDSGDENRGGDAEKLPRFKA